MFFCISVGLDLFWFWFLSSVTRQNNLGLIKFFWIELKLNHSRIVRLVKPLPSCLGCMLRVCWTFTLLSGLLHCGACFLHYVFSFFKSSLSLQLRCHRQYDASGLQSLSAVVHTQQVFHGFLLKCWEVFVLHFYAALSFSLVAYWGFTQISWLLGYYSTLISLVFFQKLCTDFY